MTRTALRKAAFLDRDGVLNVDRGYVHRREDFVWVEGAVAAVHALNDAGYMTIVVTNQSGIARGLYTLEDMHRLHAFMDSELAAAGGRIDAWYFCPFHPDANIAAFRADNHPDRKPNPGMILAAAHDLALDLPRSFLVGDKDSDIEAASRAGVTGYLFTGGNLAEFLMSQVADLSR